MKTLIQNYTFNPTAKTITFTDYPSIRLEGVLVITNTTSNVLVYNFVNPALGGTVAGNVLTLTYATGSMSATDRLQVFYDDATVTPSSTADINALNDLVAQLTEAIKQLSGLNTARGIAGDLRVTPIGGIVGTVTAVGTVAQVAGFNAQPVITSATNQTTILSNINNIAVV